MSPRTGQILYVISLLTLIGSLIFGIWRRGEPGG